MKAVKKTIQDDVEEKQTNVADVEDVENAVGVAVENAVGVAVENAVGVAVEWIGFRH